MKLGILCTVGTLLLATVAVHAAEPKLETEDQKSLYSLGVLMSQNLEAFGLSPEELQIVERGLTDGALKRDLLVEQDKMQDRVRAFIKARQEREAAAEKEASKAFLEAAAKEKGAVKTESGMIITEIKAGTGESPKATDTVKVDYTGKLRDGTVFDSSVERGKPATFPLNRVIPCWTEGLQRMKVGGKSKLVCPSDIAYGDRGRPPKIKPGAALVFDVELLEIVSSGKPATALPPGHPPVEGHPGGEKSK